MSASADKRLLALCLVALFVLNGCGLAVPEIKEVWDQDFPGDPDIKKDRPPFSGTAQIEFEIRKRIFCELKDAVQYVNQFTYSSSESPTSPRSLYRMIPDDWVVQVSLSLEVDESSSLNPGFTYNEVMKNAIRTFGVGNTVTSAQSFNLGFGATVSSTATRTDKFDPQYSIEWLMRPFKSYDICQPENDIFYRNNLVPANSSPFIIESHLGIKEWLTGAMLVERTLPSAPPEPKAKTKPKPNPGHGDVSATPLTASGGGNQSGGGGDKSGGGGTLGPFAISNEIKFVIVSSGNVNPSWKLVSISANTGSTPLFGVNRTRTHDLIITVGPDQSSVQNASLPLQIGNAVANGVKAGAMSGD